MPLMVGVSSPRLSPAQSSVLWCWQEYQLYGHFYKGVGPVRPLLAPKYSSLTKLLKCKLFVIYWIVKCFCYINMGRF